MDHEQFAAMLHASLLEYEAAEKRREEACRRCPDPKPEPQRSAGRRTLKHWPPAGADEEDD